jgi:hypothetical protein
MYDSIKIICSYMIETIESNKCIYITNELKNMSTDTNEEIVYIRKNDNYIDKEIEHIFDNFKKMSETKIINENILRCIFFIINETSRQNNTTTEHIDLFK